jgi:hypothetical protein
MMLISKLRPPHCACCVAQVYASACLRELPGCLLVATNTDHVSQSGVHQVACWPAECEPARETSGLLLTTAAGGCDRATS